MNLPITAVCKAARIKKDGSIPVSIQYCFSSDKRAIIDIGIFIPLKYWNKRLQCISDSLPTEYGNTAELNMQISKELRKAEDIISLAIKKKENPLNLAKIVDIASSKGLTLKGTMPEYDLQQVGDMRS